jgi:trehalose-6-phosphate synthase
VTQLADAILQALEMPEEEQIRRMRRMRQTVREHNVYRWAANLLTDLTEIRIGQGEKQEASQAT